MAKKIVKTKVDDGQFIKQLSQSSVTISRDGKGVVKFDIKSYADSVEEAGENARKEFEKTLKFAKRNSD